MELSVQVCFLMLHKGTISRCKQVPAHGGWKHRVATVQVEVLDNVDSLFCVLRTVERGGSKRHVDYLAA